MKLTPFGRQCRIMRLKYGLTAKEMAKNIGVSASFLSAVEKGHKTLSDKYVGRVLDCFRPIVTMHEVECLNEFAMATKLILDVSQLPPSSRLLLHRLVEDLIKNPLPEDLMAGNSVIQVDFSVREKK